MNEDEERARAIGVLLDCPKCKAPIISTRPGAMTWSDDEHVVWMNAHGRGLVHGLHAHQLPPSPRELRD